MKSGFGDGEIILGYPDGPKVITKVLVRGSREGDVMIEAEVRVMWLQAKECG